MIDLPTRIAWLLILLSGVGANGQNLPIVNAGFEADVIAPGVFVVPVPQGWSIYDPAGLINQGVNAVGVIRPLPGLEYFPGGTPEGQNAAIVYLAGPQSGEAGLQQSLAATLQPDTRYRCSVQIGNIASGTSLPGSADGGGQYYNLNGFPGYRIDVLAGTNVLAADNNSIGAGIPEGEFRETRFYFDTDSAPPQLGQNLGIRLVNLKLPGTSMAPNIEVDFDAIRLAATEIPAAAQLQLTRAANQLHLTISGTPGATYQVEFSPSLGATTWVALTNVVMTDLPAVILSEDFATNGSGFYRALVVD